MSRRDYIAVARILASATLSRKQREELTDLFADLFEADNPRFDRDRFRLAAEGRCRKCGWPDVIHCAGVCPQSVS